MAQTARPGSGPGEPEPDFPARLDLLKWHLDRYDRIRDSTASRASVVLSAGAILSAGDAVVLARLLDGPVAHLGKWMSLLFGIGLLASIALIVLSLIRATGVLVTPRTNRLTRADTHHLPPGLIFNYPDTVQELGAFDAFRTTIDTQDYQAMVQAAEMELWIIIRQHRHRYNHLCAATRLLRWAAAVFLLSASVFIVTVLLDAATR
ncbi:hypothetical protein [Streptomyces sp. BH055]|uniref:hypothetical protein n=1 Tax=Streptomyces sp. BH055 TaxID=3401173 RepID=UPI003BB611AC